MKTPFYVVGGLAVAVILWLAFASAGPDGPAPGPALPPKDSPASTGSGHNTPLPAATAPLSASVGAPPEGPSMAPLPLDAPVEAVLESIHEASISYDAKELPRIQPFLLHPEKEVRAAAIQGIIVLGDAAGGPLLRSASRQTANPKEALEMLEAADYVELPSASLAPTMKRRAAEKKAAGRP